MTSPMFFLPTRESLDIMISTMLQQYCFTDTDVIKPYNHVKYQIITEYNNSINTEVAITVYKFIAEIIKA